MFDLKTFGCSFQWKLNASYRERPLVLLNCLTNAGYIAAIVLIDAKQRVAHMVYSEDKGQSEPNH